MHFFQKDLPIRKKKYNFAPAQKGGCTRLHPPPYKVAKQYY